MATEQSSLFDEDDVFVFADEEITDQETPAAHESHWKILVVDDEEEVHSVTEMVLRSTLFESKTVEIISAYTGKEAIEILRNSPDIAVVLLDVVMEKDTSGLETVRLLREELKNKITRIVLRTGQPGKAPERSVILEYDINDYREKTELTAQKLFTTVIAALRNYRDMVLLEKSREAMQKVIESSTTIFGTQSLAPFAKNILTQCREILNIDQSQNSDYGGVIATETEAGFTPVASIGSYTEKSFTEIAEKNSEQISEILKEKGILFFKNSFVVYFESKQGTRNIFLFETPTELHSLDQDIIRIICNNISIAYENIYLTLDIVNAQKEIILRMGDVVETRSKETANHVYRVAEYSYLLAKKMGLTENSALILRHASPMHDIGKVGIQDSILLKPAKLTAEEFEIMKTHTVLGYNIFSQSSREIIQAAATIAHEHHERWDGTGYPRGLKQEEIHVYGRITSLADVFDALASKRTYKKAWSIDAVYEFILENSGTMFDPELVKIFVEIKEDILSIKEKYPDEE